MLSSTRRLASSSMQGIQEGRSALRSQFATMSGWQRGQDARFDAFVAEKRQQQHYEQFDQRVERAYTAAVKAHKTEILNAFKRRLKDSAAKYSPDGMREVNAQIEARTEWLRDVWAQIDTDYRSQNEERQQRAAAEISQALRGEPSDYMAMVYETKHAKRFQGPLGQAQTAQREEESNMPSVSDEEVNRYHNLQSSMMDVHRNVVSKYGEAGAQHWNVLQAAKDHEYAEKLERAGTVYNNLLEQQKAYDEGVELLRLRANVDRTAKAQIRFKAALELEKEREKLQEAHAEMRAEREAEAKAKRRELLVFADKLRREGKSSEETLAVLRERNYDEQVLQHNATLQRQRSAAASEKKKYLQLIQQLRDDAERREGEDLLNPSSSSSSISAGQMSSTSLAGASSSSSPSSAGLWDELKHLSASAADQRAARETQTRELWAKIKQDEATGTDNARRVVHQARMDAMATHDDIYGKTLPINMAVTAKPWQGTGEFAGGNNQDRYLLQDVYSMTEAMQWGVMQAHDLDLTKDRQYVSGDQWHVKDPQTGDIDWRYEKRGGGPVFTKPRFYKAGEEYDVRRPQERSWYHTPADRRRHRTPEQAEEDYFKASTANAMGGGGGAGSNAGGGRGGAQQPLQQ